MTHCFGICLQDNKTTNKAYAWVPIGELSTCTATFIRGVRYTTIGAISCDGLLTDFTFAGAADKETFMSFIKLCVVSMQSQAQPLNTCYHMHTLLFIVSIQHHLEFTNDSC